MFLLFCLLCFPYKVFAKAEVYDVVLFFGQSNMTGYAGSYDTEKAKGGTDKNAKKVAMRVVQQLIDSVEQGVTEGVVEVGGVDVKKYDK